MVDVEPFSQSVDIYDDLVAEQHIADQEQVKAENGGLRLKVVELEQQNGHLTSELQSSSGKLEVYRKNFHNLWLSARIELEAKCQKIEDLQDELNRFYLITCPNCNICTPSSELVPPTPSYVRISKDTGENEVKISFRKYEDLVRWTKAVGISKDESGLPTLPEDLNRFVNGTKIQPKLNDYLAPKLIATGAKSNNGPATQRKLLQVRTLHEHLLQQPSQCLRPQNSQRTNCLARTTKPVQKFGTEQGASSSTTAPPHQNAIRMQNSRGRGKRKNNFEASGDEPQIKKTSSAPENSCSIGNVQNLKQVTANSGTLCSNKELKIVLKNPTERKNDDKQLHFLKDGSHSIPVNLSPAQDNPDPKALKTSNGKGVKPLAANQKSTSSEIQLKPSHSQYSDGSPPSRRENTVPPVTVVAMPLSPPPPPIANPLPSAVSLPPPPPDPAPPAAEISKQRCRRGPHTPSPPAPESLIPLSKQPPKYYDGKPKKRNNGSQKLRKSSSPYKKTFGGNNSPRKNNHDFRTSRDILRHRESRSRRHGSRSRSPQKPHRSSPSHHGSWDRKQHPKESTASERSRSQQKNHIRGNNNKNNDALTDAPAFSSEALHIRKQRPDLPIQGEQSIRKSSPFARNSGNQSRESVACDLQNCATNKRISNVSQATGDIIHENRNGQLSVKDTASMKQKKIHQEALAVSKVSLTLISLEPREEGELSDSDVEEVNCQNGQEQAYRASLPNDHDLTDGVAAASGANMMQKIKEDVANSMDAWECLKVATLKSDVEEVETMLPRSAACPIFHSTVYDEQQSPKVVASDNMCKESKLVQKHSPFPLKCQATAVLDLFENDVKTNETTFNKCQSDYNSCLPVFSSTVCAENTSSLQSNCPISKKFSGDSGAQEDSSGLSPQQDSASYAQCDTTRINETTEVYVDSVIGSSITQEDTAHKPEDVCCDNRNVTELVKVVDQQHLRQGYSFKLSNSWEDYYIDSSNSNDVGPKSAMSTAAGITVYCFDNPEIMSEEHCPLNAASKESVFFKSPAAVNLKSNDECALKEPSSQDVFSSESGLKITSSAHCLPPTPHLPHSDSAVNKNMDTTFPHVRNAKTTLNRRNNSSSVAVIAARHSRTVHRKSKNRNQALHLLMQPEEADVTKWTSDIQKHFT